MAKVVVQVAPVAEGVAQVAPVAEGVAQVASVAVLDTVIGVGVVMLVVVLSCPLRRQSRSC